MRIARRADAARRIVRTWRAVGETVGLVPTMGALHAGHASLIDRARRECDRVVASIFVNPLQFGPKEDLSRYPRPIGRDRALLRSRGVDLLYHPYAGSMYPPGFQTVVGVTKLREPMEGAWRAGHFDGVATVVTKLLAAVEPDRLYLGRKDAQQAALLGRLARDLDFGARIVVCPTVRESDGLALSSRNAYMSREERAWAPALYRALREGARALRERRASGEAERIVRRRLAGGPGRLDYVRAVDLETLETPRSGRSILLALAYRMPSARLIDNVVVRPSGAARRGRGR